MERILGIEAFRNMGFKDGKPEKTELLLNRNAENGDLLILVGESNSGKSNTLDALEILDASKQLERATKKTDPRRFASLPSTNISPSDVTDFNFNKDCKNPKLSLFVRDSGHPQENCSYTKFYDDRDNKDSEKFSLAALGGYIRFNETPHDLPHDLNRGYYAGSLYNNIIINYLSSHQSLKAIVPKIRRYTDSCIKTSNLDVSSRDINASNFFNAVFLATNIKTEDVKTSFDLFLKTRDKKVFEPLRNSINEGLKKVAEKFNRIFCSENKPYSFEIDFDRMGLYLTVFHEGKGVVLDKQSAGFRYFFDLFFNLINAQNLQRGDIILMDEPAMNLHPAGQKEVRTLLKNYAVQNGITIIIATHSPFLVDIDNLDELRVVVNKDNISSIENDFTAVNPGDPDSLLPIREAFSVGNYLFLPPKTDVVFVHGMAAYNYLTAFKRLLGIQNVAFLPVNSFGASEEECLEIGTKLEEIRPDSFVLVENDEDGNLMRKANGDRFTVKSVSEILNGFDSVKSLFDQADAEFAQSDSASFTLKNRIFRGESVSDATKTNFQRLFDGIIKELE